MWQDKPSEKLQVESIDVAFGLMIELYEFSSTLCDTDAMDASISGIFELSNRPFHGVPGYLPTADEIREAYEYSTVGSPLRRLMVDLVLRGMRPEDIDPDSPAGFLVDVAKAAIAKASTFADQSGRSVPSLNVCNYHQHSRKGICPDRRSKKRKHDESSSAVDESLADDHAESAVPTKLKDGTEEVTAESVAEVATKRARSATMGLIFETHNNVPDDDPVLWTTNELRVLQIAWNSIRSHSMRFDDELMRNRGGYTTVEQVRGARQKLVENQISPGPSFCGDYSQAVLMDCRLVIIALLSLKSGPAVLNPREFHKQYRPNDYWSEKEDVSRSLLIALEKKLEQVRKHHGWAKA